MNSKTQHILILNYLKNKNQLVDGNNTTLHNKSYYINTNNSIQLNIMSSVYKELLFEINNRHFL